MNLSSGGATQFVAGAGGHGVQGAIRSDPRLAVMYGDPANTFGALYFKLNPKGAEYRYVNTAGQLLDQGVAACSGTSDRTAPTAPTGLVVTTSAGGQVQLSWAEAWDDTGVNAYGIYRDGALIATVGGATTGYVDLGAGLNVTYSYQVDAVDVGGRRSAKSNTATTTRPAQLTLIFNPTADAYVRSDFPATNYGSAISLKVDATPEAQSFLRFALEGVNGTVTGASLRLFAASGSATGYQVYPLTGSAWDENSVTYVSKPGTGGQVAASGSFASGGVWTETNVTPLVSGNGRLDLATNTTSTTAINLASREGANPPQLVVNVEAASSPPTPTATPMPTTTPPPPLPKGGGPRVYLPFVRASGG